MLSLLDVPELRLRSRRADQARTVGVQGEGGVVGEEPLRGLGDADQGPGTRLEDSDLPVIAQRGDPAAVRGDDDLLDPLLESPKRTQTPASLQVINIHPPWRSKQRYFRHGQAAAGRRESDGGLLASRRDPQQAFPRRRVPEQELVAAGRGHPGPVSTEIQCFHIM